MLMMDSPNAESVWPSLLLNSEKNVSRVLSRVFEG